MVQIEFKSNITEGQAAYLQSALALLRAKAGDVNAEDLGKLLAEKGLPGFMAKPVANALVALLTSEMTWRKVA